MRKVSRPTVFCRGRWRNQRPPCTAGTAVVCQGRSARHGRTEPASCYPNLVSQRVPVVIATSLFRQSWMEEGMLSGPLRPYRSAVQSSSVLTSSGVEASVACEGTQEVSLWQTAHWCTYAWLPLHA